MRAQNIMARRVGKGLAPMTPGMKATMNAKPQRGSIVGGKALVRNGSVRPTIKNNVPKGWDAQTYSNFKKSNPKLEPNSEDTARMRGADNTPKGWDAKTYANFKKANPKLEPDAEDTARMNGTYKAPKQMSQRDSYNKAMMNAQRKGGSNGIGVGN